MGQICNFYITLQTPSKLTNCTITNNTADGDNDGDGDGGGIYRYSGTVKFKKTIIAGNDDKGGTNYDDCRGTLSSQGYNLVGDGTGCPSGGTDDQTTTDPKLGLLQDNGGPTFPRALLTGSPAIDAASCKDIGDNDVTQDQRGKELKCGRRTSTPGRVRMRGALALKLECTQAQESAKKETIN